MSVVPVAVNVEVVRFWSSSRHQFTTNIEPVIGADLLTGKWSLRDICFLICQFLRSAISLSRAEQFVNVCIVIDCCDNRLVRNRSCWVECSSRKGAKTLR